MGGSVALLGGKAVVLDGAADVLVDSLSEFVAQAEVQLCARPALFSACGVPFESFAGVGGNANAVFVAVAEVALGVGIAEVGRLTVELGGTSFVGGQASLTVFVGNTQIQHRHRPCRPDSCLIVAHGLGFVLSGAVSEIVAESHNFGCKRLAGIGCPACQAESFGEVAVVVGVVALTAFGNQIVGNARFAAFGYVFDVAFRVVVAVFCSFLVPP